jgi:hypothetical protein
MAASRKISPFLSACLNAFCLGGLFGFGDFILITPEITFSTNREAKNGKKLPDGVEIRFPGHIPTNEVRNKLKKLGFRFSDKQQLWYAYDTEETRAFVAEFGTELVEVNVYTAPEGDKNWFWAKVRSLSEYEKVPEQAAIKVVSDDGTFTYKNKAQFTGTYRSPSQLVQAGKVFFKKFYQRKEETEENDGENTAASTTSVTTSPKATGSGQSNKEPVNQVIAERLLGMAQSMQKAIDHKLNPPIANQRLTRRRANIASSMRADGVVLMKIQTALYALAWAWQNETIATYFERSKAIGNLRLKDDIKSLIWRWNAVNVPANLQKIGVTTISEWEKAQAVLNELIENFRNSAAPSGKKPSFWDKMAQLNQELKDMELELIGAKIPGFFPTPLPLIKEMLRLANIKEGDVVLEPSAGKGDICDAILSYAEENDLKEDVTIVAIEQNYSLVKIIEKRKELAVTADLPSDAFNIEQGDFLALGVDDLLLVDKVVMNPPFEGGIDINHIVHAASFLKPYGKLVAILSEGSLNRSFQKEMLFKRWIFSLFENGEAFVSASIKDAFNTNTSFRQTGVAVRIITITCPADGVVKVPAELQNLLSGKRVAAPKTTKPTATNNDIDEEELLELEAIAQIEILKLANANAKAKGLQGIGSNYRAGNTRKSLSSFNKKRLTNFQDQLHSL